MAQVGGVERLRDSVGQTGTAPAPLVIGLIGSGIGASLSPTIQMTEADAQGLRLVYRLLDLDNGGRSQAGLARLVEALCLAGYDGFNVTFPVKQSIIPLLDAVDASAEVIGAVNTVKIADGRLTGYNTDATGFAAGLATTIPSLAGQHVLLLGAGGAGSAAASVLLGEGVARLSLFDVDRARATALKDQLARHHGADRVVIVDDPDAAAADADGLINATPTGMAKFPGMPLAAASLRPDLWVAEIVYFPLETELLRTARQVGCRTVHGGYMVVHQAARAFEIFTGCKADAGRMLRHFTGLVGGQS